MTGRARSGRAPQKPLGFLSDMRAITESQAEEWSDLMYI